MKVINVKNFAIKGYKNKEHIAYFIEGIESNAILFYNHKDKRYLLSSMTYAGEKTSESDIVKEINSKVPVADKFKIKSNPSLYLEQFQLGKANFKMDYFTNDEIDFYLDQAKKAEISVNKKLPAKKYSYLSGRGEYENIIKFASNLEKVNVSEIKEQLKHTNNTPELTI